MYGAPDRYNAENRARGVRIDEFEQPGSRYHGENRHRNLDGLVGNAQDPNHRAETMRTLQAPVHAASVAEDN